MVVSRSERRFTSGDCNWQSRILSVHKRGLNIFPCLKQPDSDKRMSSECYKSEIGFCDSTYEIGTGA